MPAFANARRRITPVVVSSILAIIRGGTEHEGGSGELGANLEVAMYLDVDKSGTWTNGDVGLKSDGNTYLHPGNALQYNTLDNYASETWNSVLADMAAVAEDNFVVIWNVPIDAGNDIQGDSVDFDVTFTLEQSGAD